MPEKAMKKVIILLIAFLGSGCATISTSKDSSSALEDRQAQQEITNQPIISLPEEKTSPKIPKLSGSLWSNQSLSLYQDIKARNIGDIITITISESADASEEAETEAKRSYNMSGKISNSDFVTAGKNLIGGPTSFDYGVEFGRGIKGSGKTSRTNSVKAYMTATVVDVLPNGNLVIRGSRWVKINDELHQIVLEGVVRPVDITRNNTVMSNKIANAKIFVVGKGPVTRHQKPGWLGQILDIFFPF